MANFDARAWERLPLVKRILDINPNIWYDIKNQINEVAPLLQWRPIGLEEYTDHDLNHCLRIAQAISSILPDDFSLNINELSILLYSILFHDLGMWTKKCEVYKALEDEDFGRYLKSSKDSEKIFAYLDSSNPFDKQIGNFLLRQIVAQYHRTHHASRSRMILEREADYSGIISRRIPDEYIPIIGIICASHDWIEEDVLNSELLDESRLPAFDNFGDEETDLIVDVRLLSFLLRIGDLLDLDGRRISRLVWSYIDKLSVESEAHWRKHDCLHFKKLNKHEIIISGDFNYDRYGEVANGAYHLALQWGKYLKDEVQTLQKALHNPQKYAMKPGRHMGNLFVDISGIKGTGIIFSDNLSFDMNKARIIEILGDEIYDDKSAFIRELIQNALDATRTQIIEDYRSGKFPTYNNLDERVPYCWPKEITSREEYSIHIATGYSYKTINRQEKKLYFFKITDQGIGMNVDRIKNYFLQIGKSFYKSNEFKTKYSHSSISRFGIGFLSCLLVGDYIEVVTKSRDGGDGLKLMMDNRTDLISIVHDEDANYGTTVTVMFDPEIIDTNGWIPEKQIDEKLLKYTHPDALAASKMLQAIYYWMPWSDLNLYINNQKLSPKSPANISSNISYWSLPYAVYTVEDNEMLASGSIIISKNTLIPRFDDRDEIKEHFLPTIGGIVIPPWKKMHDAAVYIDVYRQPESIITASRRAVFELPSSKVKEEIIKAVILSIDSCLSEKHDDISQLAQAMFRAAICIKLEALPLLLPVIRNNRLNWEEWDENRFKREACILVPFFAPLEYNDLNHTLPIVGVPRRRLDCPSSIIPQIENVRAITLNHNFTAALSLPNGWLSFKEINQSYTYLLYRFVKYSSREDKWKKVNKEIALQEPIRQQMPEWDKAYGNMWEKYGFDPHENRSFAYASGLLGNLEFPIDKEVVNVKVTRRQWNLLEKAKESDVLFDLLIKSLKSDCE